VEAAAPRVESAPAHARRATHGMETAAAAVKTTTAAVESTAAAVSAPATTAVAAATAAVAGSGCIGRQGSDHRYACQKSEGKLVFHLTPSSLQRRCRMHRDTRPQAKRVCWVSTVAS